MKNHSLIVEIILFCFIFCFFILSPFFLFLFNNEINNEISNIFEWTFPFQQILYALFSFCLFKYYNKQKQKVFLLRFPVILTVCLLFCSSLFMKFISEIINQNTLIGKVVIPNSLYKWACCLITFFCSAFFEEVIYRFYFPEILHHFLTKINIKKIFVQKMIYILVELLGCLVFAYAHYYLGLLSVVNAFICHIILRFCYKKNYVLWPCFTAHFIYNVISLIVL